MTRKASAKIQEVTAWLGKHQPRYKRLLHDWGSISQDTRGYCMTGEASAKIQEVTAWLGKHQPRYTRLLHDWGSISRNTRGYCMTGKASAKIQEVTAWLGKHQPRYTRLLHDWGSISQDTRGYCMTREAPADIMQARLRTTKERRGFKKIAISDRTVWYNYPRILESDWLEKIDFSFTPLKFMLFGIKKLCHGLNIALPPGSSRGRLLKPEAESTTDLSNIRP